ncbi:branched-chain amino acid transport system II carrier protein [Sodalis sp.]|uniref:branched-chain amino acid transport system II carrier protein n=1 Tax=Sodalis sp. (in: enterobacteria) TaxID=1898979 RepID=UPI003873A6CC
MLITIACLVTAVGLSCACAEFFSEHTGISYSKWVFLLGLFSMVVSNLGLSHLISISVPVLTAIYPPCIVMILMSFTLRWWRSSARLIAPACWSVWRWLPGWRQGIDLSQHSPYLSRSLTAKCAGTGLATADAGHACRRGCLQSIPWTAATLCSLNVGEAIN